MTTEAQNPNDDPIIAALGIAADDPDPELSPRDEVCGYYQEQGPERFRLLLRTSTGCWMSHFKSRILTRNPCPIHPEASRLVLRADGDYKGELVIHCPSGGGQEKAVVSALYAVYAVPETTPWHDW